MPFYDFHCEDCQREYELKLSIKQKEDGSFTCPHCGSDRAKPVFRQANVVKSLGDKQAPSCPLGGCCSSNRCGL